jgi:hypothetical protein
MVCWCYAPFAVILCGTAALCFSPAFVCFDGSWVNFDISNTCLVSSLTFAHYEMFGLA